MTLDMVRSHVETLIERLTKVEKALPDHDGDYPVRYRNALYYVRVTGETTPVVQVFSIAVGDIELTPELALELNSLNAQLRFCRTFWVGGQVLIESEHLGMTVADDDFRQCAMNVAEATDAFAAGLAARHGGKLAFDDAKEADYSPENDDRTGLYL